MKRNVIIAAVTAAALIGGGTATALTVSGDGERERNTKSDTTVEQAEGKVTGSTEAGSTAVGGTVTVTAAEAIAAALRETPGTAVSVDLDDEDDEDDNGSPTWEVDILGSGNTWHKVRIAPDTATVLHTHTEHDAEDTTEARTALARTTLTATEAARATAPKGTVTSVDLDENGTWETETTNTTGTEQDWRVDEQGGAVTVVVDEDN